MAEAAACEHDVPTSHECSRCNGVVPVEGPGEWPEEPARRCVACGRERHDVRLRLTAGCKELCSPCYAEVARL